jgi:hypothetical protein
MTCGPFKKRAYQSMSGAWGGGGGADVCACPAHYRAALKSSSAGRNTNAKCPAVSKDLLIRHPRPALLWSGEARCKNEPSLAAIETALLLDAKPAGQRKFQSQHQLIRLLYPSV